MEEFGFNTFVSDRISLTRTVPDIRMEECKHWQYPEKLPSVSVVIVFHNEGWSPLLRTVHSVLLRSPPQLLKEIVMVNDFSEKQHLKEKLERCLLQFEGKVRLVRSDDRLGLIGARNFGAKAAKGQVVVFLDAHCEVNVNWLPLLLAPIKNNRKVMTVPVIDGIDANTWEYTAITETEKNGRPQIRDPRGRLVCHRPRVVRGARPLRRWPEDLGRRAVRTQLQDLDVRRRAGNCSMQPCGPRLPASYANFGKYSGMPIISTNMQRVVKTWMGDYEQYYLTREPQAARVDPGDLSAQLALKERLKCRNFRWYMETVAYDVLLSYPLLPPNKVWGSAQNDHTGRCLERRGAV